MGARDFPYKSSEWSRLIRCVRGFDLDTLVFSDIGRSVLVLLLPATSIYAFTRAITTTALMRELVS